LRNPNDRPLPGRIFRFNTNRWYTIELHYKLGDAPGVLNGTVEVWIDGIRIYSGSDLATLGFGLGESDPGLGAIFIGAYLHAADNTVWDGQLVVDNFVVSRSYIGPPVGGGTTPPPPDTAPPTVPTGLTATAVSSSQINLAWTASTDNVGVTGYRVYRGGTQIATTSATSYQNTGLSPSTTYTYTVAAYDAAGNTSGPSTSASATTQGGGPADTDGDGLPDAWEIQHGLDPNNPADAAQDPDKDGFTNLQEYQGGSDPKNPGSIPGLAVAIDFVSTGKTYSLSSARVGALYYIDRSYTIASLSAALNRGILLRTANSDKRVKASEHLKFTATAATIYVCYDKRAQALPAWLNDGTWTAVPEVFAVTDNGASPMMVFRKSVPGGQVTLGGNLANPASGARSNYVVIVKP
jgi:hypothetical protein